MTEADDTAAKVCKALQDKHEKRAKSFKQGKVQTYALRVTVWVEQHHKDVLSRHRQASWYVPGVIVQKVRQDVYALYIYMYLLEGICCIQRFVGASEQFRAEVYHDLDGLFKEKEHFLGCQGRVGPFVGCSSAVMDPPWHFVCFCAWETGEGIHPGIFRP